MPNSLRSRISKLVYQGKLSQADGDRIREALEKQIPKRATVEVETRIYYGSNGEQLDGEMYSVYICPVCGNIVSVVDPTTDEWCARCGQRIDSSEVDE